MKPYSLFFLFVFIYNSINTQNWCAAEARNEGLVEKHTSARPKAAITIPVIVHVLYTTAEENITEEQIWSQIEVLNEDFRNLNSDVSQVITPYQNKVADMEINFELATTGPDGNPHSGIIHKEAPPSVWDIPFVNGKRKICYDEYGGSSAWNPDCYLNIWVGKMYLSFAGKAIFPTELVTNGGDVPNEEDGVYIKHTRFGTTGTVTNPYHLGRTTTHEIGHYLNLFHPWGPSDPDDDCNATTCCIDPDHDDLVEDTQPQIRTYLNECPTGVVQSCGEPDNYQNFMGYSFDECLVMFTEGQKTRVWDALMAYRPGLLDESCTVSTEVPIEIEDWIGSVWFENGVLKMDVKVQDLDWELYNIEGRLISNCQTRHEGLHSYLLPNISTGVYLLQLKSNRSFRTKKVVIK